MFGMLNMGVVITMRDMLSGPAMKVVKAVKDIDRVSNFGDRLMRSGAQMTAVGALFSGIATNMKSRAFDLARPLYELEDSLAIVRAATPGTFGSIDADIAAVTRRAEAWEQAHKQNAVSYVQANYRMISSGLDMKAAIAGTDAALALATATMGDATTASNLLATLYNNLGDKLAPVAGEMMHIADVVTKTQLAFQLADLGQLNEGLKYAAPAAIAARMELAETSATIGLLNSKGLQGGQAGTAFGAVLRNLNKASKDLRFEIARTSDGGVDLTGTLTNLQQKFAGKLDLPKTQMAMQTAFGDEGMRAVTLLLAGIGEMQGKVNDVRGAVGITARTQRQMEQTGSTAWQKLGNQVDAMKRKVAESLTPAISTLIPKIASLAQWVGEFAKNNVGILTMAGYMTLVAFAVLSILAPIAIVGGTIVQVVGGAIKVYALLATAIKWVTLANWAFTASMLANPITWIVLGIVALCAILVALVVYWDDVAAAAGRAWEWVKDAWGSAVTWVKGLWSRIVAAFQEGLAWLRQNLVKGLAIVAIIFLGPVAWAAVAVALIIRNWSTISAFFGRLWAGVKTVFFAAIAGIWSVLRALPGQVWSALVAAVSFVVSLPEQFFKAGAALFGALWDGMKSVASSIVGFVIDVLREIRSYLPFSDAEIGPLSNLTASGKAFGTTWAQGIRDGMPDVQAAVEDVGKTAGAGLGVANLSVATASGAPAPGTPARGGTVDAAPRSVTVNIHSMTVQAKDMAEGDAFVKHLQGLAMEVAVAG